MYNNERKERYLSQCSYQPETKGIIRTIFTQAEKVEIQLDCDLSDFQQNIKFKEITSLLRSFNSKSRKNLIIICEFLEDYYNWCISECLVSNIINPYEKWLVKNIIDSIV